MDRCPARFLNFDIFPRKPDYPEGQQRQLFKALEDLISYYRAKVRGYPCCSLSARLANTFTRLSRKTMSVARVEKRARDMNLLREACRFVRKFQPDLLLSENVAGIGDPKYGGIWEDFQDKLEREGYVTGSKVVCTRASASRNFRSARF